MHNYNKSPIINFFGIIITILSIVITVYGQYMDPTTGTIFFLGILIFIVLYFLISYPLFIIKQKFIQIKNNSNSIEEIRKDLYKINDKLNNIMNYVDLNARVSIIEKKHLK